MRRSPEGERVFTTSEVLRILEHHGVRNLPCGDPEDRLESIIDDPVIDGTCEVIVRKGRDKKTYRCGCVAAACTSPPRCWHHLLKVVE